MKSEKPLLEGFERWEEYTQQKEYFKVREYIQKEENVFMVYANNIESSVKAKVVKGELGKKARDLIMADSIDDKLYFEHISEYVKPLIKKITHQTLCTKDVAFCQK